MSRIAKLKITLALAIALALLTTGQVAVAAPAGLDELKSQVFRSGSDAAVTDDIPRLRADAIRDRALGHGVSAGALYAAERIMADIDNSERMLDRLFSFQPLVLEGKVLPPVITEARDARASENPNLLRAAVRIYRIDRPGRLFTVAPGWRDYLYVGLPGGRLADVHPQLLPRNDAEQKLWERYLEYGWQQGVAQVNEIYAENLARLEKDYTGMLRYLVLYERGLVSSVVVTTSYSLVTGDRREVAINERVHAITEHAGLETDHRKWRPVVVPGQGGE